jgi:hypothetical protein
MGIFGEADDEKAFRAERRALRAAERLNRGPLDQAAAEINFDDEARKILSRKLNLGADGVSNTNETYNDFDIIYRCPKGGIILISDSCYRLFLSFIFFHIRRENIRWK